MASYQSSDGDTSQPSHADVGALSDSSSFEGTGKEKNRNLSHLISLIRGQPMASDSDSPKESASASPIPESSTDVCVDKASALGPVHWALTAITLFIMSGLCLYTWHLTQRQESLLARLMTMENQAELAREMPATIARQLSALTIENHGQAETLAAHDLAIAKLSPPAPAPLSIESALELASPPAAAMDKPQVEPQQQPLPQTVIDIPETEIPSASTEASARPETSALGNRPTPGSSPIAAESALSGNWQVNLAILSQEASARHLANKLSRYGGEPQIKLITVGGITRYQVRMLGFSTRESAELAAQRAARLPGLSGVTVSRN